MEDRYLYKAKRTDNGEWVKGFYVRCRNHDYILPIFNDCEVSYGYDDRYDNFVEVDPSTICQCTGYKEIWEHDIFQSDDDGYIIQYDKESLEWMAVSIFANDSILLGEFYQNEIDVIGNEIDNPELLEVK